MRGPGAFVQSTDGSGVLQDVMPFCGCLETLAPRLRARLLCSYHGWCRVLRSVLSLLCLHWQTDSDPMRVETWVGVGLYDHVMGSFTIPSLALCGAAKRIFASSAVGKTKGTLPPVRRAKALEQVKQFISEHCDFGELKDVHIVTLKRNHYVTGYPRCTWIRATGHANECEVGMGDERVRTETLLQRLTRRHWNSDSRRILLQFCHSMRAFGGPTYSAVVTKKLRVALVIPEVNRSRLFLQLVADFSCSSCQELYVTTAEKRARWRIGQTVNVKPAPLLASWRCA